MGDRGACHKKTVDLPTSLYQHMGYSYKTGKILHDIFSMVKHFVDTTRFAGISPDKAPSGRARVEAGVGVAV